MLANKAQGSKSRQLIDGYVIHGDEGSYQFKWWAVVFLKSHKYRQLFTENIQIKH